MHRDSNYALCTDLALYVHKSIENRVSRRSDLEIKTIECIWIEITDSKTKPVLVGYVHRNPASSQEWSDEFINMMDKVTENNEIILLLGEFNINLFKQPSAWNNTTSFGLDQLVEEATRVTKSSATLNDHIYTNSRSRVTDVRIVESGISDHCAIFCHWSLQLPNQVRKDTQLSLLGHLSTSAKQTFCSILVITSFGTCTLTVTQKKP